MANNSFRSERFINGYSYFRYHENGNTKFLKCTLYRSRFCKGRGIIMDDGFRLIKNHNHGPNRNQEIIYKFNKLLKKTCQQQLRSGQNIYHELAILHPHAAALVPWQMARSNIYRWQQTRYLPSPSSLIDLKRIIYMPRFNELTIHNYGEMDIRVTDSNRAVVYIDVDLCDKLIEHPITLYISSSKSVLPEEIMNTKQNIIFLMPISNYIFSLGSSLIIDESSETLREVIEIIHHKLRQNVVGNIYYNFDHKIYHILQQLFPNSQIKGTFSSHCQILIYTARRMNIEFNDNYRSIILKIVTISLLPQTMIEEAFHLLIDSIPAKIRNDLTQFIEYNNNNWIHQVGPQNFSFFNDLSSLVDCCDAQLRRIKSNIEDRRTLWNYTTFLLKDYIKSHKNLDHITARRFNRITGNPRSRYIINRGNIQRLWNLIADRTINIVDFFTTAANLIDNVFNDIEYSEVNFPANMELFHSDNEINANIDNQEQQQEPLQEHLFIAHDRRCVVCLNNAIEVLLLPCRHGILCNECLLQIENTARSRQQLLECPLCKQHIDQVELLLIE